MKKIAVLLTVHNRKQKTLACLRGLFKQGIPEGYAIEVYLTDDGCTDGTREAVETEFPAVNIVSGDGNLFWNRGMYKAWEAASKACDYDFYLWLNDDTVLLVDALKAILDEACECPDSVIIGSTCSSIDLTKLTYGGYFRGHRIFPNGQLQDCQTFNGNIVLVPNAVFSRIGNLDWTYQHAMGDVDYGWMVTKAGMNSFISKDFRGICDNNPNPPMWTRVDVSFIDRWKNFHSPLGYSQPGSMFYFNRKNFGFFKAIKVWITNHLRVFFPGFCARISRRVL